MSSQSPLEASTQECVNKSYLYGLASGSIALTTFYFLQKHFTSQFRGGGNPNIIRGTSVFFGAAVAYLTANESRINCIKSESQRRDLMERMAKMRQ